MIEDVYLYLTEAQYPKCYTTVNKRAIRKKAQKFVVFYAGPDRFVVLDVLLSV